MYSYREQLEIVNGIHVREGESLRIDCPFCRGKKTFTISKYYGVVKWNCYRASCEAAGIQSDERTTEGIKAKLHNVTYQTSTQKPIPFTVGIQSNESVLTYLRKVCAYDAFAMGRIAIRYAPAEDRVMFPTVDGRGYAGRARQGVHPKWLNYGDTRMPVGVGQGSIAVVVEDAASACAVGAHDPYKGVALLGTHLTDLHRVYLAQYPRILVCLDPDARNKSISLALSLQSISHASPVFLPNDPKNLQKDELKNLLSVEV